MPGIMGSIPLNNATKPAESRLTPRQQAALQLKGGDNVKALDPVTGQWSLAVVHGIAKNGLIQVRWDNPGVDAKGRPFHPIGEVWAEQIQVQRQASPTLMTSGEPCVNGEQVVTPPDGLQIGDTCFAAGTAIDKKWFCVKLIGTRARSPPMRIEYLSTLDGQTNELLLPSPRKDYVHLEQICRHKPEQAPYDPYARRTVHNENMETSEDDTKHMIDSDAAKADDDEVVITPDLMCSVCERPDDEPNMLVCDCGSGFHIYCLSPPLDGVPEGEWQCSSCTESH